MTKLIHDSQHERYCQARLIFDQKLNYWNEKDDPELFEAFKIFTQLADEHYGKSYYPLSVFYDAERDTKEIQELDRHYEQMNFLSACNQVKELNECQDKFLGANRVITERTRHFQQLAFAWCYANKTNLDAELWCDLGDMYLHGCGVEEDHEQAASWHHKAAEHGYAEAQYNLSHSYTFGIGVPQSDKEAEKWCRLAADQGLSIAQANLVHRQDDLAREEQMNFVHIAASGCTSKEGEGLSPHGESKLRRRSEISKLPEIKTWEQIEADSLKWKHYETAFGWFMGAVMVFVVIYSLLGD